MGGGGGNTAMTELPAYVERLHYTWLTGDYHADPSKDGDNAPIYHGYTIHEIISDNVDSPLLPSGNPYGGEGFLASPDPIYDSPATTLGAVQTQWEAMDTVVEAMDDEAEYAAMLLAAATEVDTVGRLKTLDIATMLTSSKSKADDAVTAALAIKDGSGIAELTDWPDFIDAIQAKIDEAGILTELDWATIEEEARTGATSVIAAALLANDTGVAEVTSWDGFVDAVVAKLQECGVLENIDVPTLFNLAMSEATSSVEEAVTAAASAIDDDLLAGVVNGYDQRISYARQKAVRTFAGQMADINAVHSSAFLMGLALIHSQYEADLNRFDAELSQQTYQRALELHGQRLDHAFQMGLNAAGENVRNRAQLFLQSLQSMTQLAGERIRFEQALTQLYGSAYSAQLSQNVQSDTVNKAGRDRVMLEGAQHMVNMLGVRSEYEKSLIALHSQIFLDILGKYLTAAVQEKDARDRAMMSGVDTMARQQLAKRTMQMELTKLLGEQKRIAIVATAEYQAAEQDRKANYALFPFLAMEHASNILSGPAGMAGIVPVGQSKASSAIGGALQGAGTGAMVGSIIPGVGTAVGAVAGAALGGLAGWLQ